VESTAFLAAGLATTEAAAAPKIGSSLSLWLGSRSSTRPGKSKSTLALLFEAAAELSEDTAAGEAFEEDKAAEADEYIGGLMIMNDLSARRLQMEEMLLNLGPAKGKDFSTAIGPWLVTLDELQGFEIPCKENHTGAAWNLEMKCWVNGNQVSSGNVGDMDWTFAEIIERASYGVDLYPGDVIGSGTVGTGCFLELNGTGKLNDPNYTEQWLQANDIVEMEIDGLGKLSNKIIAEETDWSILKLKK